MVTFEDAFAADIVPFIRPIHKKLIKKLNNSCN